MSKARLEGTQFAAYLLAIPRAFVSPRISCAWYTVVALIWLMRDRRVETALNR